MTYLNPLPPSTFFGLPRYVKKHDGFSFVQLLASRTAIAASFAFCISPLAETAEEISCAEIVTIAEAYDPDFDLSEKLVSNSDIRACFYEEYHAVYKTRYELCEINDCGRSVGGGCNHLSPAFYPSKEQSEDILNRCKNSRRR